LGLSQAPRGYIRDSGAGLVDAIRRAFGDGRPRADWW